MSIFTPEYIVLAVSLLVVGWHLAKKRKTNEGSGREAMNRGAGKRLP